MIIVARKLDITTRDIAPQPGDYAFTQRGRVIIHGATAHWPVMGMWEVKVSGVRKPEIAITVAWLGKDDIQAERNNWREVAGR